MAVNSSRAAHAVFALVFVLVLLLPHFAHGLLKDAHTAALKDPYRDWATEPLVKLDLPTGAKEVLDGSYARTLDHYLQESLFSRYLTAVGNEVLYACFGTFRPPWIQGRDGWVFWQEGLGHIIGEHDERKTLLQLEGMASMLELVTLAFASKGIETIVVPIPKKAGLCSEYLPRGRDKRAERDYADPVWNQLVTACRRHDVKLLDLRPRFRSLIQEGKFPFYKQGTHLSPQGVYELSEMIAAEIRGRVPALKERRGDPAEVELVVRRHTTDAAFRMGFRSIEKCGDEFRFDLERREFPKARINIKEEAEVALAGTSFGSRFGNRMGGKANLARALSWHLDTSVADHAIHGGGPIRGILEILKSVDELPRLKAVIIEFPFRSSFSLEWSRLGRELWAIPWTQQILIEFSQKNPGEQQKFAAWINRK